MTNVVEFKARDLTPSEREQAERLLWTENAGKGWKARSISSTDWQFLAALEQRLQDRQVPAGRVTIIAALARLANHFRTDRPADAWQMLFEDYAEDLEGISEGHLREIISSQRHEKSWFPKSAELIERWNILKYREGEQWRRARVLLDLESPKPWEVA